MPSTDMTCRKRLLAHGAKALTDTELLSVLFGAKDDLPTVSNLVKRAGGVASLSYVDLNALRDLGVRDARAAVFLAHLELNRRSRRQALKPWPLSPEITAAYIMAEHSLPDQEVAGAMFFDFRGHHLGDRRFFIGARTRVFVEPRPILREALRYPTAEGFLVFHTQPGAPAPSERDVAFTYRLDRCSREIGLTLVDHMIVGDRGEFALIQR